MKARTWFRASVVLILLAVIAFGYCWIEMRRFNEVPPFRESFSLSQGNTLRGTFKPRSPAKYEVQLDFERALPHQTLVSFVTSRTSPIRIRWQVRDGTRIVASDADTNGGRGAYWGPTVGEVLGTFVADPKTTYQLEVESLSDVPLLARTNPHVQVERDVIPYEKHLVGAQLAGMAALLALIGAVGTSCTALVIRLRGRRAAA